jgi:hypothetical protein
MDAPATLVWVAPEPPDAQQANALSSWSAAYGIKLSRPAPGGLPHLPVDASVGDRVESMLRSARDAIAAREREQADRALDSAESILRAHPELPQAPWLMAEVERAKSARFLRIPPVDLEAAERAWLRAEALDGGRVPGMGEPEATHGHGPQARLTLELSRADGQAWLDGEFVGSQTISLPTRAGLHSLVVTRAGGPVWAAWIDVPAESSTAHPDTPVASACTADDLANVTLSPGAVDARHVRCQSWIAAFAGTQPGSVRISMCKDERCGPLLEWRAPAPWAAQTLAERGGKSRWPAWATWTAVGAGIAVTAGVLFFSLKASPLETRFVSGGLKTQ